MTVDHVGAYLYPDLLWLRAIGRLAFPLYAFLVGHALHYPLRRDMVLWALVLALLSPLVGVGFFPLNVLVLFIVCQGILTQVEKRQWLTVAPWTMIAASVLLLFPSMALLEHGVLGFLYMLMGYAVRSRQMTWRTGKLVAVAALVAYLVMECVLFAFPPTLMACVILSISAATWYLAHFRRRTVRVAPAAALPARMTVFLSRYSMPYYVVHRLLLQATGVWLGTLKTGFHWF